MQLGCVKCGGMFELTAEDMERGSAECPHCGTRYRARRPETTAVSPQVISTAIVQINDYGEYVVNAWEISID